MTGTKPADDSADRSEETVEFEEYVRTTYPEIRRCDAPPLFSLNGFGTGMFGKRDQREDGSYLKTYGLTALFVPIASLSAYRVMPARGGGWYFLGEASLSSAAKLRNWGLLAGAVIAIAVGMLAPTKNDERLDAARTARTEGRLVFAVDELLDLRTSTVGDEATAELRDVVKSDLLDGSLADIRRVIVRLQTAKVLDRLFDNSTKLAYRNHIEDLAAREPHGALALADPLDSALGAPSIVDEVLVQALGSMPDDPVFASEAACRYEQHGEFDQAYAVLEPARERLTTHEGARILGFKSLQEGDLEAAIALFEPYVESRMDAVRRAGEAAERTYEAAQATALEHLDAGEASERWYLQYQRASEEKQAQMVREFLGEWIDRDAPYAAAVERLGELQQVVPTALELAIARLTLARSMPDEARAQEMRSIEKLMLSMQAAAGGSDRFQLGMAQVQYWLGRTEEGDRILAELEANGHGDPSMMLQIAHTVRMLGRPTKAYSISEATYESSDVEEIRFAAASLAAVVSSSPEDRVKWLERSDRSSPAVRAGLAEGRARLSSARGDFEGAKRQLREAIGHYDEIAEDATLLNNRALAYRMLFDLTSETEWLSRSNLDLRKAHRREPSNPILLSNLIDSLFDEAVHSLDAGVDIQALGRGLTTSDFRALSTTGAELETWWGLFANHEATRLAETLLRRFRLLAPKSYDAFHLDLRFAEGQMDLERMRRLATQTDGLDLDQVQQISAAARESLTDEDRRLRRASLERSRAQLEACRALGGPSELLARLDLASALLGAFAFGEPVDADAVVVQLDAADSISASIGGQALRASLGELLALERASRIESGAAELVDRLRRQRVDPRLILLQLVRRGGAARTALLADDDLRAATDLRAGLGEQSDRLVGSRTVFQLRSMDHEATDRLAARLAADSIRTGLLFELLPSDPGIVLARVLLHEVHGEAKQAEAVEGEAMRRGVILR